MAQGWVTILMLLASAAPQPKNDDRKLWAYPRGVIVSSTVSGQGLDKLPELRKDLDDVDTQVQKVLENCAAEARAKFADVATHPRRYRFDLTFALSFDGEASDAEIARRSGERELLPCFAAITRKVQDFNFRPFKSAKPVEPRISYDVLLLNDEDAQGRGYRYLQGEERWEKAVASHPEWFACKRNDECVATNAMCEPRAVAKAHLDAYVKAIETRVKPACRPKAPEPPLPRAVCRQSRCILAPTH